MAGVLEAAGLYLGSESDILGPESSNEKGHFENLRFVHLNEALLRELGGSWDEPPTRFEGWEREESWAPYRETASKLLAEFPAGRPWGWKDPRTTLLVPFWRSLLSELRFVVCLRNPFEVALSLQRRDGAPLAKGSELWVQYTCAALQDTAGAPRFFLFYDEFLDEPDRVFIELAGFCGLDAARSEPALAARLSGALRHHEIRDEEVLVEPEISGRAKVFYYALRSVLCEEGGCAGVLGAERDSAVTELARTAGRIALPEQVAELSRELELRAARVKRLERRVEVLEFEHARERNKHERNLKRVSREYREYRDALEGSTVFRLMCAIWRVKEFLLPTESGSRRLYERLRQRLRGVPRAPGPAPLDPAVELPDDEELQAPLPFEEPLRRAAAAPAPEGTPLVSIIMRTCPGRIGCLQEAASSVLEQDHPNLELVLVEDGGSEAASWARELPLGPTTRLTYQPLPEVGRCVAGNRGLEIASGRYCGFLDDDDRLYPEHVSTLVDALEERPELGGAYSVAERVFTHIESFTPFVYRETGRDIALREVFDRQRLWIGNLFPIQAALFRRELFEEHGGFHPGLDRLEDWDLWTRYTSRRDLLLIDRVTSMYRVPADLEEETARHRALDGYSPLLRMLQRRTRVSLTPRDFEHLLVCILEERKYYRVARRLRFVDVRKEMERSPLVQQLFAEAEASGAVETTVGTALELANQIVKENGRLSLFLKLSQGIQRRPWLKGIADRCYLLFERHM